MYEGIHSEVIKTTRFDEKSDLSTTYIGKIDITGVNKIKAEEIFLYQNKGIQWKKY